jgi:hypothetical protein
MAYHFLTNQTPFSWMDCMGRLIRTMCSAGWQQIAFSNGITVNNNPVANPFPYNALSNSLGSATDASLNFNTDRAWICLQQPPVAAVSGTGGNYAGIRQIVIQWNGGDHRQWRIKYSFSGGYTNPAVTGTVRTTPTINSTINDEVYLCGGGSDISPTFDYVFYNGTEGGARMHYVADDGVAVSGSCKSPYGFAMWGYTAGGANNVEDAFMMDPMLSGTCPDTDPDPFVFYRDNSQIGSTTFNPFKANTLGDNRYAYLSTTQNGQPLCWWKKNTTAQTFLGVECVLWSNSIQTQVYPANPTSSPGQNALTFSDDQIPVTYVRPVNQYGGVGYKGMSSLVNMNSAQHPIGAALSVLSNRDRFVVGNFTLPWDGTAPQV